MALCHCSCAGVRCTCCPWPAKTRLRAAMLMGRERPVPQPYYLANGLWLRMKQTPCALVRARDARNPWREQEPSSIDVMLCVQNAHMCRRFQSNGCCVPLRESGAPQRRGGADTIPTQRALPGHPPPPRRIGAAAARHGRARRRLYRSTWRWAGGSVAARLSKGGSLQKDGRPDKGGADRGC